MKNSKNKNNIKDIVQSEEYKLLNELLQKELNYNSTLVNSILPKGRSMKSNLINNTKKDKMYYKERIELNSVKRMYKENKQKRDTVIKELNNKQNVKFNLKLTIK